MEVLAAHQERIAGMRETLDRLIGLHRRLYELRSQSWREQESGDPDRAEVLEALHQQIDDIESETGLLREEFRHVTGGEGPGEATANTMPVPDEPTRLTSPVR